MQVIAFSDNLRQVVLDGIIEDCGNCGFTASNFANEVYSCGGSTITFRATLAHWDFPEDIRDGLVRRYVNQTEPIFLPTSNFVSGSVSGERGLEMFVLSVEFSMSEVASSGDGMDRYVETTAQYAEITTEEDENISDETTSVDTRFTTEGAFFVTEGGGGDPDSRGGVAGCVRLEAALSVILIISGYFGVLLRVH